ncbi:MAG: Gfo/Idh/MocA family oxidoreductase [Gemmataceae bacterium]|nr:Gfo/Idh/MocA family oxidoreductase [Gemmataceae bacterium]
MLIDPSPSRRDTLKVAGSVAAASVLASLSGPGVHAASGDTVQFALIGCGGRGTGAAENALKTAGPTKLVAMADVFEGKLNNSYNFLSKAPALKDKVEVPPEKRFIGFDGYKKAMDCLRPGDVAIFATPPAFRWVHFQYAIEKGLNVFMEKPVAVDGPTCKRMFELAEKSEKKGLKVAVGLMCRHCDARNEMFKRVKDGAIGDLVLLRAYRMAGKTALEFSPPKPDGISDLMYQIQRFHSFLWASGGSYSDFLIHNIDEACWFKDAWPVKAVSSGGRHYRGNNIDQNFDTYSTEFTFADGSKFFLEGRCIDGCHQEFATYAHGTKGSAIISSSGHAPSNCRLFKTQSLLEKDQIWSFGKPEPNPYQLEWDHFMDAIRNEKAHNEAKRGTEASLATAMGRFAAHTGQVITREKMLEHPIELAPKLDELTKDSKPPVEPDKDGKYPVPEPGRKKNREY